MVRRMTKSCYESPRGIRELGTGRRKGNKKTFILVSLYKASGKMAGDLRIGPLETRDGGKTFAPVLGQMDYEIPVEWMNT